MSTYTDIIDVESGERSAMQHLPDGSQREVNQRPVVTGSWGEVDLANADRVSEPRRPGSLASSDAR